MEEKILAAIAALNDKMDTQIAALNDKIDSLNNKMDEHLVVSNNKMDALSNRIDTLNNRMNAQFARIDKHFDNLESRVTALEAGQKETHQMLRAVLSANEKNSAEIEGLKVSTASVTSLQDLRRDVADSFAYVAQKVKEG